MSVEPEFIGIDDSFDFLCRKGLSCFNMCCRDVNQFLYPYDIIRLKNNLGIRSDVFLEKYTFTYTGDTTGFPVVSFKTQASDGYACPFVSETGCTVYSDRPASCRMFPLARAISRSRQTGEIQEHFALIKDPICEGFNEKRKVTVRDFVSDQDLADYNRYNDKMIELISLKQQIKPGRLEGEDRDRFILACYNVDGFRDAIFNDHIIDPRLISEATRDLITSDDVALMELGSTWLTSELFGKPFAV